MKIKRKITVEVDRLKITVPHYPGNPGWCGICRANAEFVEPNDAARLVMELAAQGMKVVEGDLHFYNPDHTRSLICLNSIISRT